MLDMSNIVDAIHVSSGATLDLTNITVGLLHTRMSSLPFHRPRKPTAFFFCWHHSTMLSHAPMCCTVGTEQGGSMLSSVAAQVAAAMKSLLAGLEART